MIVRMQIGVLQVLKATADSCACWGRSSSCADIIGLAPNLTVMAFGFAMLGISFACANPGINGCASMVVEPWEQGAAQGFLSAGNTLGAILGPIIGTQIYTHLGNKGPMIVGAIALTLLSIYAFTIKVPDHRGGSGKSRPVPNDPPPGQSATA
jgi:MFS family permease